MVNHCQSSHKNGRFCGIWAIDPHGVIGVLLSRSKALIAPKMQPDERRILLVTAVSCHSVTLSHQVCREIN